MAGGPDSLLPIWYIPYGYSSDPCFQKQRCRRNPSPTLTILQKLTALYVVNQTWWNLCWASRRLARETCHWVLASRCEGYRNSTWLPNALPAMVPHGAMKNNFTPYNYSFLFMWWVGHLNLGIMVSVTLLPITHVDSEIIFMTFHHVRFCLLCDRLFFSKISQSLSGEFKFWDWRDLRGCSPRISGKRSIQFTNWKAYVRKCEHIMCP